MPKSSIFNTKKAKETKSKYFYIILIPLIVILISLSINTILKLKSRKSLDYYISPTGNSNNSGSKYNPLGSISDVITKITDDISINNLHDTNIIVHLQNSTYTLSESIDINLPQLKENNINLIFKGKTNTIISGSINLSKDNFVKYKDDIYSYDLSKLNLNFNYNNNDINTAPELIFNDEPMTLSRYPNEDYLLTGDILSDSDNYSKYGYYQFSLNDSSPFNWADTSNIYMKGYWFYDWSESTVSLSSFNNNSISITDKLPYGIETGQRFFIFNSLDALDVPGEYYIDYDSNTLYFIPPENISNNISLSLLDENFFNISNSSNITFENILFENCRSSAINLDNCSNITIDKCTMRNLSNIAINLINGNNNTISNCIIYNTGNGGIYIESGDRNTLTSCNILVEKNEIYNYSTKKSTYSAAININGVGITVSKNIIYDAPHNAIQFAGNDHIIDENEIYNVCKETNDAGAIYSYRDWTYRGNIIRNNYIHDLSSTVPTNWVVGIYLDDCMSSAEVYNNVIENVPLGMLFGGGRDMKITQNTIKNCDNSLVFDERGLVWLNITPLRDKLNSVPATSNIWTNKYPEISSLYSVNPAIPYNNTLKDNTIIDSPEMNLSESVQKYGTIENNIYE